MLSYLMIITYKVILRFSLILLSMSTLVSSSTAEKNDILNISPSLAGSYLAGRFARSDNDTPSAAKFYQNALSLDPSSDMLIEQGLLMEASQGAWQRAIGLAESLVRQEPKHRMALIFLALDAFKKDYLKKAEKDFKAAASGPIGEITSALAIAWTKMAEKDYQGALNSLTVTTKADWAQYYLLFHQALIADLQGRSKEAKNTYEKLFQKDGKTLRTILAYIRSLAHSGDLQAAKSKLMEFMSQPQYEGHILAQNLMEDLQSGKKIPLLVNNSTEGLTEAFYGLGESLITEGAIGVGIVYLQMALYITPEHPYALAALANAYEANKQYEYANETYSRIKKGSPLEIAIDIRRALNLNSLDKSDQARSVLEILLTRNTNTQTDTLSSPDSKLSSTSSSPFEIVLKGRPLVSGDKGEDVQAVQNLLKILGYNLSENDLGNFDKSTTNAIKKFQKTNRLLADGKVNQSTLKTLIKFAKIKESEKNSTTQAHVTDPNFHYFEKEFDKFEELQILDALGNIMRSRKQYSDAVVVYSRAIDLIAHPEQKHWIYFYARGTSYERIKNWPLAEKDLKKALELYPDQPLALNYLGYSWIDQGINLEEGMQLIERAVSLKPDDGYIVDSLGWAHYKRRNFKEAVRYLERAVELRPDDPVLNDHLGDALWQVGRQREAKFQWDQSLSLSPEPEDAAKIHLKIQEGLSSQENAPSALAESEKINRTEENKNSPSNDRKK